MTNEQAFKAGYGELLANWTREDLKRLAERLSAAIALMESSGADATNVIDAKLCIVKAERALDK